MAVMITCPDCGETYCRNEGPQNLHVCKTPEQQEFERKQELQKQFEALARADLRQYAEDLEAENKELKAEIERLNTELHELRSFADCYRRVCETLKIEKDILGYIERLKAKIKESDTPEGISEIEDSITVGEYALKRTVKLMICENLQKRQSGNSGRIAL